MPQPQTNPHVTTTPVRPEWAEHCPLPRCSPGIQGILPPWMSSFQREWEEWASARVVRKTDWFSHELSEAEFYNLLSPNTLKRLGLMVNERLAERARSGNTLPATQGELDLWLDCMVPVATESHRFTLRANCPPSSFREGSNGAALPGGAALLVETSNRVVRKATRLEPSALCPDIHHWVSIMEGGEGGFLVALSGTEDCHPIGPGHHRIWAYGQEVPVILVVGGVRIDREWVDYPYLLSYLRWRRRVYPIKPISLVSGLVNTGLLD